MERKVFSKKTRNIIIVIIIIAVLATSFTFLGIFLRQRNNPIIRFAKAEQNWIEASAKKAYDDLAVEITLGKGDNTITALLTFAGKRSYNGDNYVFEYDASVIYKDLSMTLLNLNLKLEGDNNGSSLIISKTQGLIDFETVNLTINQEEIANFEFGNNTLSIYDTSNISIDKQGSFSINGDQSVALLLSSASMIMGQLLNMDIDINALLAERSNIGRVRGNLVYDKAFRLGSMSNTQNISFFMKWEDADQFVESVENIPENIKEIYDERKITIENIPLLGSYTLDFMNYMPDGITANIRIINTTRYEY